MRRHGRRKIRDDIWSEIENLVNAAKAAGPRLGDLAIAKEIIARYPDSGLTVDPVILLEELFGSNRVDSIVRLHFP